MQFNDTLVAALKSVSSLAGTDLVFTIGDPPMIRLDGGIWPLDELDATDENVMREFLADLLSTEQMGELQRERDVDFAFTWENHRFRGNAFYQRGMPAISLRNIPSRIPSLREIGLPDAVHDLVNRKQGLILFCGPTGSGKSTSMASLVEAINQSRPCHVITIEDPIEYLHKNRLAVVHQREVGIDASSFTRALRAALREDPDVVLVGEMRDPESIAITLTLAETGHLVLSSLHTNDAAQSLDRIIDVFPTERQGQIRLQLAGTMLAVVAQRLCPRIGGGLSAVFEVLLGTPAVTNLIREGKTNQLRNAMQIALGAGHKTLEMSLNELVAAGVISQTTASETALVPHEVDPTRISPLLSSSAS